MTIALTALDLAGFLRSRKSTDCKMAADWVEENPEHPTTLTEMGRLGNYLSSIFFAKDDQSNWLSSFVDPIQLNAALSLVNPAAAEDYQGNTLFEETLGYAEDVFRNCSPSWAAVIVRKIKVAQFPQGQDEPEEELSHEHTAGPWFAEKGHDGEIVLCSGTPGESTWPVCVVEGASGGNPSWTAEVNANYRLIKNAPELLRVLESILYAKEANPTPIHYKVQEAINAARAVLDRVKDIDDTPEI